MNFKKYARRYIRREGNDKPKNEKSKLFKKIWDDFAYKDDPEDLIDLIRKLEDIADDIDSLQFARGDFDEQIGVPGRLKLLNNVIDNYKKVEFDISDEYALDRIEAVEIREKLDDVYHYLEECEILLSEITDKYMEWRPKLVGYIDILKQILKERYDYES